MTSVVIGGAGFIGRRLIPRLVERGEDVVCMDINPDAAAFEAEAENSSGPMAEDSSGVRIRARRSARPKRHCIAATRSLCSDPGATRETIHGRTTRARPTRPSGPSGEEDMYPGTREHAVKPNPSVDTPATNAASSPAGGGARYASAKSGAAGGGHPRSRAGHVPAGRPLAAAPRVLHGSVVR